MLSISLENWDAQTGAYYTAWHSLEIFHDRFHFTGHLFGICLKLGVDILHPSDLLLFDAQVVADKWAYIIRIVLLIIAGIFFNGVPVAVIEALLLFNVKAHQNKVTNLIALI